MKQNQLLIMMSMPFLMVASASGQTQSNMRPVEILSDPYVSGNPTHYTILRNKTKVTFSHAIAGQFSRAEISMKTKTGFNITRFLLSPDGKRYLPTLKLEQPFETHYSTQEEDLCVDPIANSQMNVVQNLSPKVAVGELIAKKRTELVKSNFFDKSCFPPSISIEHSNAILNGAADVFATDTQNEAPNPKYLICLEKYKFAHASGIIQGMLQATVRKNKAVEPLKLLCTKDRNAKTAVFDDASNTITLRTAVQPDREYYAKKIFHEALHAAPIEDGPPLQAMEECCTKGKMCEILKEYGNKLMVGEKSSVAAEAVSQKNSILTGIISATAGASSESISIGRQTKTLTDYEMFATAESNSSKACQLLGKESCEKILTASQRSVNQALACLISDRVAEFKNNLFLNLIVPYAEAISSDCNGTGTSATMPDRVAAEVAKYEVKTVADLATLPQTSPISWEVPEETPVPIRMASGSREELKPAPTRTIASVSPLPEERPQRALGSKQHRADVGPGRATFLVDTLEKAATKVTKTLTPEKLQLLAVEKADVFSPDFKPKTKSPQYLVASSVSTPLQIADIGDLKDLSFPNPFVGSKPDHSKVITPDGAKPKRSTVKTGSPASATSAKDEPGSQIAAPNNSKSTTFSNTATAPALGAATNARSPSANTAQDFRKMDRDALSKFITSSYRTVAGELESSDFIEALATNRIQILDHEGRRIGAVKPDITFVYRSDLSRLVQTRADRDHK